MRALNAPDWLIARPIAHRGLHDAARGVIENTLAAAEAAVGENFAIECDVQLSADEEVFVFHDDTLDRLTDATGAVIGKSAAEILQARIVSRPSPRDPRVKPGEGEGASIPTLSDFLSAVAGRVPIVCELKSRFDGDWRIGERVAALAGAYEGPLALKSFDPDLIAFLRLRYPRLGPPGRPCPIGIVAEASYDDPVLGLPHARAEARLRELRPPRPQRARLPVLEREGPAAQDPVLPEGMLRPARHDLDGADG